jgi:hypothetical protein
MRGRKITQYDVSPTITNRTTSTSMTNVTGRPDDHNREYNAT